MRVPSPYPLYSLKLLITCELQANATELSGLRFGTTAADLEAESHKYLRITIFSVENGVYLKDHPRKDMVSLPALLHPQVRAIDFPLG